MTKLERTVRASRRSPQRRPPQTEVGFIDVASIEVESAVTNVPNTSWSWLTGERQGVTKRKTRTNHFVAYALGSNGSFEVARSTSYTPEGDSIGKPVEVSLILNDFLVSLIQDGWVVTPRDQDTTSVIAGGYRDICLPAKASGTSTAIWAFAARYQIDPG